MFDLKEMFENELNGGNLSFESGLDFSNPDNVVDVAVAQDDAVAVELQLESALADLATVQNGFDAIDSIDSFVAIAKNGVANGTATFETAIKVTSNINTALSKIGFTMSDFTGDQVTFESAQDHAIATLNSVITAFEDNRTEEELTSEAAKDDKSKWQRFKDFVKKILDKVIAFFKNGWTAFSNLFRGQDKIIENLISKCDDLITEGKLKDKVVLTAGNFKSLPYAKDHNLAEYNKYQTAWEASGNSFVDFTSKLVSVATDEKRQNAIGDELEKSVKAEVTALIDLLVAEKVATGIKKGDKGLFLSLAGEKIKVLKVGAGENKGKLVIETVSGKTTNADKKVKPMELKDIKAYLQGLRISVDYTLKTVAKLPNVLNSLKGINPKESATAKVISIVANAATVYSKSASSTSKALVGVAARHMSAYEIKKEA